MGDLSSATSGDDRDESHSDSGQHTEVSEEGISDSKKILGLRTLNRSSLV